MKVILAVTLILFFYRYIVSDCWAIDTIVQDQKFLDVTSEEGVALSMKAG